MQSRTLGPALSSGRRKTGAVTLQQVPPFGFKLQEKRCNYNTRGGTFWFQITRTGAVTLQQRLSKKINIETTMIHSLLFWRTADERIGEKITYRYYLA